MRLEYIEESDAYFAHFDGYGIDVSPVRGGKPGRISIRVWEASSTADIIAPAEIDRFNPRDVQFLADVITRLAPLVLDHVNWYRSLHQVLMALPEAASPPVTLPKLIWRDDLDKVPGIECLIDGFIQTDSVGAMIGNFASAKTITFMDMAASVGTGRPWHGREVRQGNVLHVYAEGIRGVPQRVQAWERANGTRLRNVAFLPQAVPLLQEGAVDQLLTTIRDQMGDVVFIIIDTLARAMSGGDENSTQDMGRMVEAADRLKRETGAAVWFAHHTNRLGEYRGNTALLAGLDNAATIEKKPDGSVVIESLKSKDLEPFAPITLLLEKFEGSVALVSEDAVSKVERLRNNLSPAAHELLEVLKGFPDGAKYSEWVEASGKSKGGAFTRPHTDLKAAELVVNEFGKWKVVPQFQTVPRNTGASRESERFHSSSSTVGTGTGTTFPEPETAALVSHLSDGSNSRCSTCDLYVDPRFPHESCAVAG
jgi:hypothetical protein